MEMGKWDVVNRISIIREALEISPLRICDTSSLQLLLTINKNCLLRDFMGWGRMGVHWSLAYTELSVFISWFNLSFVSPLKVAYFKQSIIFDIRLEWMTSANDGLKCSSQFPFLSNVLIVLMFQSLKIAQIASSNRPRSWPTTLMPNLARNR